MKELKFCFSLLFIVLVISSCTEDNDYDNNSNLYLTEYKEVTEYSQSTISFMFNIFFTGKYSKYANLTEKISSGVKLYKVKYKTKFKGEEIIASGLISVPDKSLSGVSFFSYNHGTILDKDDAPTESYSNTEYRMISFLASLKYIVLIPDYIGFGESSQYWHPYMCKEPTTTAIIDFMKAAKEVVNELNITGIDNNLYMLGYSQGGWATMASFNEIEKNNSVNLNIKAVSCGGSPFDIRSVNDYVMSLDKYKEPYYLPYVFKSYKNMEYINIDMSKIFETQYLDVINNEMDGTSGGDDINKKLTTNVNDLFTEYYLNNYSNESEFGDNYDAFKDNSILPWKFNTRVFLHHGQLDSTISQKVSEKMYNDLLNLGVSDKAVSYHEHEGLNHVDASLITIMESISQFNEIKNEVPAMALTSE